LRHIAINPNCTLCDREPETVIHALWDCNHARYGTQFCYSLETIFFM